MKLRRIGAMLRTLATLVASGAVSAHNVTDWPLERKVAEADLVAYVRTLDPICCTYRDEALDVGSMAAVKVLTTLKGKAADEIVIVDVGSDLAGLRIDCCIVGARYLMFLDRRDDGSYAPVNFHYGVYRLDDR